MPCPAGEEIVSLEDCKAAAAAKGLIFGGESNMHKDHIDCFQATDGRKDEIVSWAKTSDAARSSPGGYFKTHYSALCRKASEA